MTAENLFIDDCNNWQTIEAVGERFPQLDTVTTLTYIPYNMT